MAESTCIIPFPRATQRGLATPAGNLEDDVLLLVDLAGIVEAVATERYPLVPDLADAIDAALDRVRRDLGRAS